MRLTCFAFLMVLSYVLVLGGTLLDNAKLFDQVSHLAASDSLTGLANHRRLIEVLESEIQRSRRTGRSFAVLLFDLDGLKKINDRFGHLAGSARSSGASRCARAAAPSIRQRVTGATSLRSFCRKPTKKRARPRNESATARARRAGACDSASVGVAVYPTRALPSNSSWARQIARSTMKGQGRRRSASVTSQLACSLQKEAGNMNIQIGTGECRNLLRSPPPRRAHSH